MAICEKCGAPHDECAVSEGDRAGFERGVREAVKLVLGDWGQAAVAANTEMALRALQPPAGTVETVEMDREEDGRYIADVPSVPGAVAYGETKQAAKWRALAIADEALARLKGQP